MPFETTGQELADNFQKLGGATPGFVKNDASGNWQFGQSGSSWQFIETKDIASAVTSVTFTGLDGDVERAYRLVFELGPVIEPGSPHKFFLQPNGLSTNQETIRWQSDNLSPFLNFFQDTSGMVMTHLDKLVPTAITDPSAPSGSGGMPFSLSNLTIDLEMALTGNHAINQIMDTNTIVSFPAANDVQLNVTASANDDYYNGGQLRITSGAGTGEIQTIVDYVGATQTVTLAAPFTGAVLVGDTYEAVSPGVYEWINDWGGPTKKASASLVAGVATHPALNVLGSPNSLYDTVSLDGVDDLLRGNFTNAQQMTICMVVKLPPSGNTANSQTIVSTTDTNFGAALWLRKPATSDTITLSRIDGSGGSVGAADGDGFNLGQWAIVTLRRKINGNDPFELRINGKLHGAINSGVFGNAWGFNGWNFGGLRSGGVSTHPGNIEFAAIINYRRANFLTDAEMLGLEQYLANKYGVTLGSSIQPWSSGWVDFYAESGVSRLMHGFDTWLVRSDANPYRENNTFASWTDTSTNVTSLTVSASVANGIPAGSRIALYKIDKTP